jgi:hypothetical protein
MPEVSTKQRQPAQKEVEDETPVAEVLEEAENVVVAPEQPAFHQRNGL